MRFNEFKPNMDAINEGIMGDIGRGAAKLAGGTARALGGVVGGAVGSLSAAKQGYQAGKAFASGQGMPQSNYRSGWGSQQYYRGSISQQLASDDKLMGIIKNLPPNQQDAILKKVEELISKRQPAPEQPKVAAQASQTARPQVSSPHAPRNAPASAKPKPQVVPSQSAANDAEPPVANKSQVPAVNGNDTVKQASTQSKAMSPESEIDLVDTDIEIPGKPTPQKFAAPSATDMDAQKKMINKKIQQHLKSVPEVPPPETITPSAGKVTQASANANMMKQASLYADENDKPSLNTKQGADASKLEPVEKVKRVAKTQRTAKAPKIPKQ